MPAAAVIPAPRTYTCIVAVKTLVVENESDHSLCEQIQLPKWSFLIDIITEQFLKDVTQSSWNVTKSGLLTPYSYERDGISARQGGLSGKR